MAEEKPFAEVKTDWTATEVNRDEGAIGFSPTGFINYIVRYGGGTQTRISKPDPRSDYKGYRTALTQPVIFREIRKFILDTADKSGFAAQFFAKKFFTFTSQSKGSGGYATTQTTRIGQRSSGPWSGQGGHLVSQQAENAYHALQCSLFYKTQPRVTVTALGNTLATNGYDIAGTDLKSKKVQVTIQSIKIDKITKKGDGSGGKIAHRTGEMTIEFWNRDQKAEILQLIADTPELGYFFDVTSDYTVTLENHTRKPTPIGNAAEIHRAEVGYEALLKNRISFATSTIKYAMTSWKPHQNKATFVFHFGISRPKDARSLNKGDPKRASAAYLGAGTPPDASPAFKKLRWQSSIAAAIIRQLELNGSLFTYSLYRHKARKREGGEEKLNCYRVAKSDNPKPPPKNYVTLYSGECFLLRSLIAAAVQTFRGHTSMLDPKFVGNMFISEETYDALFIGVDEDAVPCELVNAPFLDDNRDVRNTWETIIIDVPTFATFMSEFAKKDNKITLPLLLTNIFNVLVKKQLMSNVAWSGKDHDDTDKNPLTSFIAASRLDYALGELNISATTLGGVYKRVNATKLSEAFKRKTERSKIVLDQEWTTTSANELINKELRLKGVDHLSIKTALWGDNRFKMLDTSYLHATISLPEDESPETALLYLLAADKPPSSRSSKRTSKEEHIQLARQLALRKTGDHLGAGVIPIRWYDRKNPAQNANWRFENKEGETPFIFSVLDNKHKANISRAADADSTFFQNIYQCSFSVYDYLGFEPYGLSVYFPPSFFGFQPSKQANYGVGDAFGISGIYTVNKVSISYTLEKPYFVSAVSLFRTSTISKEPRREQLQRAGTRGSEKPETAVLSAETAEEAKRNKKIENNLNKLAQQSKDQKVLTSRIKELQKAQEQAKQKGSGEIYRDFSPETTITGKMVRHSDKWQAMSRKERKEAKKKGETAHHRVQSATGTRFYTPVPLKEIEALIKKHEGELQKSKDASAATAADTRKVAESGAQPPPCPEKKKPNKKPDC